MEAYLRKCFCSGPFSTSRVIALELKNERRAPVKSESGGEARTGKLGRAVAGSEKLDEVIIEAFRPATAFAPGGCITPSQASTFPQAPQGTPR